MEFRECINQKGISAYRLSKMSGLPYSCISDLCLNKTATRNLTLEKACRIAGALRMKPEELLALKPNNDVPMRYFRNNVLHELNRLGDRAFVQDTIRKRTIDLYYKNGDTSKALYLLALVDHLCVSAGFPVHERRYNHLRGLRLDKPLFVGGDAVRFDSIESAEKALGMPVIAEFAKYNIVEVNICDVA